MKRVGQIYRENLVKHIKEGVDNNSSVFLFKYSNISGGRINSFRKNLKQSGAQVHMSKNSAVSVALKDLELDGLVKKIEGQNALVWSNADAVEISKLLVEFAKSCEGVSVVGGVLEGQVLDKAKVEELSNLPSREVLLGMLLSTLNSPMTRLLSALNSKTKDLLSILKQLSEKREEN